MYYMQIICVMIDILADLVSYLTQIPFITYLDFR